MPPSLIVNRHGKKEKFDARKIYGSVYAACRSDNLDEKVCERMASAVSKSIAIWARPKKSLTSDQIFREVLKHLKTHDKDIAFLYETHRDIS